MAPDWNRFRGTLAAPVLVAVVATLALAAPARAAFPGRNGELAVQPEHGGGIVLVPADGSGEQTICAEEPCKLAGVPAWSPDGRMIAFLRPAQYRGAGPDVIAMYADGSCVICSLNFNEQSTNRPTRRPSFRPDGWTVTYATGDRAAGHPGATQAGDRGIGVIVPRRDSPPGRGRAGAGRAGLANIGVDGFGHHRLHLKHVSGAIDPAWSAGGRLAFAARPRGGSRRQIYVTRHGAHGMRRLTGRGGRAPTWSPDGKRLAFVRNGRIYVMLARGGRPRRVTHGRAHSPAFSPDGRRIAFVRGLRGAGRVATIGSRGRHPRAVGDVRGRALDWQPLPARRPRCTRPPRSRTVAASATGIAVTRGRLFVPNHPDGDTSAAYLACAARDGRWREVFLGSLDRLTGVLETASLFTFRGPFVAFASLREDSHGQRSDAAVSIFDLRDGLAVANVDVIPAPPLISVQPVRQLLVTAHGTAVWRAIVGARSGVEQHAEIRASDAPGGRLLDSGPPRSLSNLTLSGDTASWLHDGTRRSATLK